MRWSARRMDPRACVAQRSSGRLRSARRWWVSMAAVRGAAPGAARWPRQRRPYRRPPTTIPALEFIKNVTRSGQYQRAAATMRRVRNGGVAPSGALVPVLLSMILMLVARAESSGGRFVRSKPRIAFLRRGPPALRTAS